VGDEDKRLGITDIADPQRTDQLENLGANAATCEITSRAFAVSSSCASRAGWSSPRQCTHASRQARVLSQITTTGFSWCYGNFIVSGCQPNSELL
jgi:hypothetical protein